jgi:hypothetical protein
VQFLLTLVELSM